MPGLAAGMCDTAPPLPREITHAFASTPRSIPRHAALALGVVVTAVMPGFAHAADGMVKVQWFGQSAFKITTVGGKTILVDPFITKNPKTPPEHKDLAALGKSVP